MVAVMSPDPRTTIMTDVLASKLIEDFTEDITFENFKDTVYQMQNENPELISDLRGLATIIFSAKWADTSFGQTALAEIIGLT